ncbi:MAG: globin domain-containing protein [Pseudomonadota bacterium]
MSLDDRELDLLRATLRDMARAAPASASIFYDRLFEIAPETRPLFTSDMEQQGVKMMSTLGAIVAQLHDQVALAPIVADLARRHVAYGVVPAHYEKLGEALLWTVARSLGPRCTPEVRVVWTKAYAALAAAMLEASAEMDHR